MRRIVITILFLSLLCLPNSCLWDWDNMRPPWETPDNPNSTVMVVNAEML